MYLDRMYASGDLVVSDEARALARAVLSPPAAARWIAAPATWTNRIVTLGLLPPSIRRQYGFDWTAGIEGTFNLLVRTLRAARRVTPDALALWPEASLTHPTSPIPKPSEIINH